MSSSLGIHQRTIEYLSDKAARGGVLHPRKLESSKSGSTIPGEQARPTHSSK